MPCVPISYLYNYIDGARLGSMDSSSAPSLAEAEIYKKTAVLLVPSIWSEAPRKASANRPWREMAEGKLRFGDSYIKRVCLTMNCSKSGFPSYYIHYIIYNYKSLLDDMGMSWPVGDPMADIQCYYVMAIEDLPHFQTHPNTPCWNAIMIGYISH